MNRYNYTGYTTPDGYNASDEYIVLLPDSLSDTCKGFKLSTLTATDGDAWRFHMLMFWNSSYDASLNPGAFQSIKMYLYEGDLTPEEVVETPITLYAPISFNANEVPFVRGFLEYEQQVLLNGYVKLTFKVVDTTTSPWYNAEDAVDLAASYGTDSLASIQLDIRSQSFYQYAEVRVYLVYQVEHGNLQGTSDCTRGGIEMLRHIGVRPLFNSLFLTLHLSNHTKY